LTTMTTVLGLAPLLYERSADAQFLKPTVVTLSYGLGFGMVVVLMLVPAILAMQLDVARQMAALRRAVRHPRRTRLVGSAILAAGAFAVLWFALTLGQVMVFGALSPLMGAGGIGAALALFLGGLCVGFALFYVGVAAVMMRRHKAS
jgi:hypothetical protein